MTSSRMPPRILGQDLGDPTYLDYLLPFSQVRGCVGRGSRLCDHYLTSGRPTPRDLRRKLTLRVPARRARARARGGRTPHPTEGNTMATKAEKQAARQEVTDAINAAKKVRVKTGDDPDYVAAQERIRSAEAKAGRLGSLIGRERTR
jgi:hypothetical protein